MSLLLRAERRENTLSPEQVQSIIAVSVFPASVLSWWLTVGTGLAFAVWIYSDGPTRCAGSIKRWGFTFSSQTA